MFKNRLFNISVIVALVVVTALTIQQALETTKLVSAAGISGQQAANTSLCEAPVVARSSIHSVYVKEIGMWVSRTDSGPTGMEGGLIHLLSDYRICSQ